MLSGIGRTEKGKGTRGKRLFIEDDAKMEEAALCNLSTNPSFETSSTNFNPFFPF